MFKGRRAVLQPITLGFASVVVCACFLGTANATPSITLSHKSGPPTIKVLVSGTGFRPGVIVDLYFDKIYRNQCVTNSSGDFSNLVARVPKEAQPGTHLVSAIEQPSGPTAKQPFLVQTNWRQFHFDADGRRVNPFENVLNPKTVGHLELKWSAPIGGLNDSSPAVVDGVVYIGGDAFDATTGALLWSSGNSATSGPAVSNGLVYFPSPDNNVYALDVRTGVLRWAVGMPAYPVASPTVLNGAVYVGSDDGSVYALDARTGAQIWSKHLGAMIGTYTRTALIANGMAYFPAGGSNGLGGLFVLDASTGHNIWGVQVPGGVLSSPAIAAGVVYFGSNGYPGAVYALKASDGSQLWRFQTGSHVTSSPAIENGVVYIGSEDSHVYALNAITGAVEWSYQTGNQIWGSPAVANEVVYVGSADQNLYALDAKSGSLLWSYNTGGYIYFPSPTVANGMVYIASADLNGLGTLYAFGLPDGNRVKPNRLPARHPQR